MNSPILPAFKGVSIAAVEHCRQSGQEVDTINAFDELPPLQRVYCQRFRSPKFVRRMRRKQRYPKD